MIKLMVVGFSFYWRFMLLWVRDLTTLAQFQLSEMSLWLFQDFHCTKNETADLVTSTEVILLGKLHFYCRVYG